MGMVLFHPSPCLSPDFPEPDPDYAASLTREERKRLMQTQGASILAKPRQPFVGEIKTFASPIDPEYHFSIRRATTREHLARQNLSATMRYITREDSGEFVTERDLPTGELKLQTLKLVLADWDIGDAAGNPLPINEDTIQRYLDPREFEFLYDKALECNPAWGNSGEEEIKNVSEPVSPSSSENS